MNSGCLSLKCEAILFDMDGVLVDSMAGIELLLREWALSHGLDPDYVVELSHGRRDIDVVRLSAPFLDAEKEARAIQRREVSQAHKTRAMRGAFEMVDKLRDSAWAVVTSGSRAVATARLTAAGIREPKVLVSSDDVTQGKPDPEGYLTAARRLGVPPAKCIVFEDASAGMQAARAAGMRVVGVTGNVTCETFACDVMISGLATVTLSANDSQITLWLDKGEIK